VTIRVALEHRTTYTFAEPVQVHPHTVRLRPAPHSRTPIAAYSLTVSPRNHFINWQQDPFGNYLARLVFPEPVKELDITVDVVADMTVINPFDFFLEEYAERYPFEYPDALRADLEPYLRRVDEAGDGPGPLVRQWVQQHITGPYSGLTGDARPRMVDFLVAVNTACSTTSPTRCGWRQACRPPTPPCRTPSAPAATPHGCWSRRCARRAWRPGSSPATWCS